MAGVDFGGTIGLLKNALEGAGAAHSAMAHNIANVNTPNFHRTDVSFKEQLAEAAGMNNSDDLQLATTSPNDIYGAVDEFAPAVTVDDQTRMRQDGNNVDIDQEMSKLSSNADYSATGAQFLRSQYTLLKQVITG